MEVEIKAGAKFDMPTAKEIRDMLAGWQAELARNVRLRHVGTLGAATAGGVLTIGPDAGLGPNDGFMWEVTRVMVSGLTAAQTVAGFINDTSGLLACGVFAAGAASQIIYGQRGLILQGNDRLIFSGTGLTASGPYPVALQVTELPVQLAPRFL
jgi:hypothetical protein